MNTHERAAAYNEAFPDRPPLSSTDEWVTGTWCIGACYKNPNPLYGAYPHGYLERVHSMFPDARKILHVFSGGLTLRNAMDVAGWDAMVKVFDGIEESTGKTPTAMISGKTAVTMELVDVYGPEQSRYPTWQGDILDYCALKPGPCSFDLILADPPYSPADAKEYGYPMPIISKVMRALRRVARPGANLVWLDQKWPMHRKEQWKTWGQVGLVRSTNHRMRLVSMFEAT